MSRPPTVDHTMPPTPVNAMQMPSMTPARLANQRLMSVEGARNSSMPTDTPIAAAGGRIVNTHIPDRYCVAVVKNWVDLDNRYNARPENGLTVTLQKSADGGKTWKDVENESGEAALRSQLITSNL